MFSLLQSDSLLIQEIFHGLFALPAAFYIWKRTKDIRYGIGTVLVSYAIDADHLLEYFLAYGLSFNLSYFLAVEYFKILGKSYVIFHAWEWIIGFILESKIAKKRRTKNILLMVAFALLAHLIYDSISIGNDFLFYSFTYRLFNNFSL